MMLMMKSIMLVMFRDDPLNGFACSNGILPQGKGGGGCDNADDAVGNFYDGNGDESKDVGS